MVLIKDSMNIEYVKWNEVEEGAVIRGFILKSEVGGKFQKLIHYLETPEGKRLGLNGSGSLDNWLAEKTEKLGFGLYVEITYTGLLMMEKGNYAGKECHTFEYAYDPDRIHPLYSGKSGAHEHVEYKQPEQPGAVANLQPPVQNTVAQPAAQPAQNTAPAKQKRSAF